MTQRVRMLGTRAAVSALLAVGLTGCAQASDSVAARRTASPPVASATSGASTASGLEPDLQTALNQVPLPPGSVRLKSAAQPSQPGISVANSPRKITAGGYWRSPRSRLDTMSWLAAHLTPPWTGGDLGTANGTTSTADYDRKPTARLEGPNYTFSVEDTDGGSSVIVTAWEIPLPAKSDDELLSGVTGATLSTKDEVAPMDAPPLRRVTLTEDQAKQLADEVNALGVDDGSPHSCLGGSPDLVLDFATGAGERKFLYSGNCNSLQVMGDDKSTVLDLAGPLYADVTALLKTAAEPVRGTLIVTLAPNLQTSLGEAGTITVSRNGTQVDSGTVASGRIYVTTERPGVYDLTAASAGGACKTGTATVVAEQQVDVTLICPPA